jgi:hypothetical protein
MRSSYLKWKQLWLFCLGIVLASSICMKWLENDFILDTGKFSILGLELFYPKDKLQSVLTDLQTFAGIKKYCSTSCGSILLLWQGFIQASQVFA